MAWKVSVKQVPLKSNDISSVRKFASATNRIGAQPVKRLKSWNLEEFCGKAFKPQVPAHLPRQLETSIAAQQNWFNHDRGRNDADSAQPLSPKQDFWSNYRDLLVPLELTTDDGNGVTFLQTQAPLGILLQWMEQATPESGQRLYLAQCRLADLPHPLRKDVPTPEIVLKAGKGDVYDANLWMGLAPTYTPLHRDPNPNLFLQLAGKKVVKLFPPDAGASIFAQVQEKLGRNASGAFRGEEMMQGVERELLEWETWDRNCNRKDEFEAIIDHGEALFIPLGWWHSIKGVGKGITASANWWFR
jgi:hypothetical protein